MPGGQREDFMAQKFTSLEEAADLLGVSKDRLNQLREANALRAYRDGASWKFRAEDIEKLVAEGLPPIEAEPSGLTLDVDDELPTSTPAASGLDLGMLDEDRVGDEIIDSPPSDLNLEEIDEPTVAADSEDEERADVLTLNDDPLDLADSILLSEAELGAASSRPPSTIIGKADLDLDLDLSSDLDLTTGNQGSDVKLAPGSDILSAAPGDDLALEMEPPSVAGSFAGLEELEVDLEAESSRILAPDDLAKARSAAAAKAAAPISDLELAPTDSDPGRSTSQINLSDESAVGTGLTGLSALELEDDEDQVLGDGSDVTLSGESSGINIISPSDSGLALDEVPLDLAGSTPMGSSLDLGEISDAEEVKLEPLAVGAPSDAGVSGAFQLTPVGDEAEEEEKDSSQVIALDEVSEEESAVAAVSGLGDSQILAEDFGAVGLAPGAIVVGDPAGETQFSTGQIVMLTCSLLLLTGCGMLVYDLLRNMWSWNEATTLNSSLLEALNPFL
jgi:excisionase family DNA binding protein